MMKSKTRAWGLALLLVAAALSGLACSEKEPEEPIEIGDDQATEEKGARFGLGWGEYQDHPAFAAIDSCRELDDVELNLLRYVIGDEDIDADEVAPIFGDEIDEEADEFEQKRQRDAVAAKLSARLAELRGQPLCVRREIIVDEYDFDAQGFQLPEDLVMIMYDDLTASGEKAISRLETKTMTRRPEGFRMPSILGLTPAPSQLPVPEDAAEKILEQLPKTAAEDDDAETNDDSPRVDRFGSLISRMEPEALEAALVAEEHTPEEKEDRPVGEVFTDIEDEFAQITSGRKAEAVLVFRPFGFELQTVTEKGVDVPLKLTVGKLTHMVATTPSGEVFSVAPTLDDADKKRAGTRTEVDRDEHDPLLEKVCRGGVETHVDTQLRDGELVDVRTPRCRRCPKGTEQTWGGARIEEILWGSFTGPGAIEALVHTTGCESMAAGGGGLTMLQKLADGAWHRVGYNAGDYGDPRLVRRPDGRDVIVSRSMQVNGGEGSGYVNATTFGNEEPSSQQLFPIYDNRGTCNNDYLVIEPDEVERADLDGDGVLDVTFKVRLSQGTRGGSRCDFGENDGIGEGETLEVSFLARSDELALSKSSKKAHAKIVGAYEGRYE